MGERKYPWLQEGGWDRGGGKPDKFLGPRGRSPAPGLPGPVSMAISPLGNYNPIASQPDNISVLSFGHRQGFFPGGQGGLEEFPVEAGDVGNGDAFGALRLTFLMVATVA